jgi:hypothetical protein
MLKFRPNRLDVFYGPEVPKLFCRFTIVYFYA